MLSFNSHVHKRFKNVQGIFNQLSDFHRLVCWSTKLHAPLKINRMIAYRSYIKFDEASFSYDMSVIPHHVGEIFDDVEDSFWFIHKLSMDVMNEHAPIKNVTLTTIMQAPFMNNTLLRSINDKGMLCRKNEKFHNKYIWELYKQRNLCTKKN